MGGAGTDPSLYCSLRSQPSIPFGRTLGDGVGGIGGPIGVQKGYIQLFVSRVVVGKDGTSLEGPFIAIAQASMDGLPEPSALVPTFVQRWRA